MTDLIMVIEYFQEDMQTGYFNQRNLAVTYQAAYPKVKGLYELLRDIKL